MTERMGQQSFGDLGFVCSWRGSLVHAYSRRPAGQRLACFFGFYRGDCELYSAPLSEKWQDMVENDKAWETLM